MTPDERAKLRLYLTDKFSLSELQNLVFDLGLDYDRLPHQTREELARELVAHCERTASLPQLVRAALSVRPDESITTLFNKLELPAPATALKRRLFLSYKRDNGPDENLALNLYESLGQQHYIFIDQTMPIGTKWAERLENEMRQADFLIVLLSAASVRSEMVEAEIKLALELAAQNGRPTILPVRVNFREPFQYPLSAYLNSINWAFWHGPEDTQKLLTELNEAITSGALNPDPTPIVPASVATGQFPAPKPSAQPLRLELPEGTMQAESAFYIERPSDNLALDTIKRQGETITIKGPRQMGKSSLLIRTVETATRVGKQVAFLDFQFLDETALQDADRFYPEFCAWLGDEVGAEDRVEEYFSKPRGNSLRCTSYMEYLLKTINGPLVLAMDEVESLFDTPFRSDFFSMLRGWHNNRSRKPLWRQLDLVFVTSTEPYQLIENLNLSPFNVGQTLDLTDFTLSQVAELNRRHGRPFDANQENRLYTLLSGHPYLTRRAMYLVADGQSSAVELLSSAADARGPFGDHLRYHLFRLQSRAELVEGMRRVLKGQPCQSEEVFFRLQQAGLVRLENRVTIARCQLYADYFRGHLE